MTQIAFISLIKPKNIKEACADDFWTIVMQEELNQFVRNNVVGTYFDEDFCEAFHLEL